VIADRRTTRRARLPGVRALCLGTKGEQFEAKVRDLGKAGLFVQGLHPLAVGGRLSIDLYVEGETDPWCVIGRVVWTREADEGEARPAGLGIKLVVVDDPIAAGIERLIDAHEGTEGASRPAKPARERTILGVGASNDPPPAPAAPILAVAPAREATIMGVADVGGESARPLREASVPTELVTKKSPPARPASAREGAEVAEESEPPPPKKRKGGARYIVLLLLAAAAAPAYLFRDRLRTDRLRTEWREWGPQLGAKPPAPAQIATTGATASPNPTPTPNPTAVPAPTPTLATPAVSTASAPKKAPATAPSVAPARRSKVKPEAKTEDNPY
jgi:Tfp pilus assembly protein PilZ